jgi:hypothetical protein
MHAGDGVVRNGQHTRFPLGGHAEGGNHAGRVLAIRRQEAERRRQRPAVSARPAQIDFRDAARDRLAPLP